MHRLRILGLLAAAASISAFAQSGELPLLQTGDPALSTRIRNVRDGLLPAVVLKGEPLLPMRLKDRMAFYKVPGVSIAVVHRGQVEWALGFGFAALPRGVASSAATLFQAGSISKPVAAVGALGLVEEGKLSLDEDVNARLKSWHVPDSEFTRTKKVTLREILSHSAGLTMHGFPGYATGDKVPTLVQVLDGEKPANTAPIRVDTEPGTTWRYSGGGFTVLQQLIIDVTGKRFEDYMKEAVLQPFGMNDSTFSQQLSERQKVHAAVPYGRDREPIAGGAHIYPEMAAAGLWTTATDLALFITCMQSALAGKSSVLTREMAQQMLSPQFGKWGLGIGVSQHGGVRRFEHGGVDEGFEAYLVGFDNGEGAVVMTNAVGGSALANEILLSIAHQYAWSDPESRPRERSAITLPPSALKPNAGQYRFASGDPLSVELRGTDLYIQMRGEDARRLYPESGTKFFTLESDTDFDLQRGRGGKASAVALSRRGVQLGAAKRVR
jgi:CubicO group peptidase (beta-lactamase class C family)